VRIEAARSPEAAPNPVPEVVARHRADDADHQHDGQPHVAAPDEIARDREDRLLGQWHPDIAEHDDHEQGDVAPVA
jgi:hypothetical protein